MTFPHRAHSHVFVQLMSAVNGNAARDLKDMKILNFSDSASLGGVQSITLTLEGRFMRNSGMKRPVREVLAVGDLIRASGFNWTGQEDSARLYGLADAIITDVNVQENLQDGSYQLVTSVNAQSLQSVLSTDAVAWWMYYGTQVGALRTRGELMPDDVSGRLDKTIANYLNKVALNYAHWTRDNIGLKKRLGLDLRGLPGNTPVARSMTVAEGSHWDIVSSHADLPLHELFMQMRSANDATRPNTGAVIEPPTFKPTPITGTAGAQQDDGAQPYIVLRPAPFPYADENGQGRLDDWQALPLHDFTHARSSTGQRSASRSLSAVRNFFMVYPSVEMIDERMAFSQSLAVVNHDSIRRYSYRPIKFRTRLILKDGDERAFLDIAQRLTWRIAGQMNRMDEMVSVQLSVPFSPAVQPGDRARFLLIGTDTVQEGVWEGYVVARSHSWSPAGGQTTLSIERALPASVYQDAAWFVKGLERVEIKQDAPTAN